MTVPKKPRARRAPAKKLVPAQNKTALGQTIIDAGKSKKLRHTDDTRAAAKVLYESDPKITKKQVAEQMGIPYATIDRWSKGEVGGVKWAKIKTDMSELAHAAADKVRSKLSELGPEITTEQHQDAMNAASEDMAVDLRAKVLERHRKEWNAPRQISYEAIKSKDFDRMKQAKITSETLKLIQDGERKAWGIDSGGDGNSKVTVVIERE